MILNVFFGWFFLLFLGLKLFLHLFKLTHRNLFMKIFKIWWASIDDLIRKIVTNGIFIINNFRMIVFYVEQKYFFLFMLDFLTTLKCRSLIFLAIHFTFELNLTGLWLFFVNCWHFFFKNQLDYWIPIFNQVSHCHLRHQFWSS